MEQKGKITFCRYEGKTTSVTQRPYPYPAPLGLGGQSPLYLLLSERGLRTMLTF